MFWFHVDALSFWIGMLCINLQEAAEELAPRLETILQHLMCAFGKYQVFIFFTPIASAICDTTLSFDPGFIWISFLVRLHFLFLNIGHLILSIFIPTLWFSFLNIRYHSFQRRNLRIVYDAIGTLADAVGGELNQVSSLSLKLFPQQNPLLLLSFFTKVLLVHRTSKVYYCI